MTLLQRLALLGLVFCVAVAGLVVYVNRQTSIALADRIKRDRLSATQVAAGAIDGIMSHATVDLVLSADSLKDSQERRLERGLSDALAQILSQPQTMFHAVALLDERGAIIGSAPVGAVSYASDYLMATVLKRAAGNATFYSDAFAGLDGTPRLAIIAPIAGLDGGGAYLAGLVDPLDTAIPHVLQDITDALSTGHADLMDRAGQVLATTEPEYLARGGDHPEWYQSMALRPAAVVAMVPDVENEDEEHVMAFVPLKGTQWALSVGGTKEETFAVIAEFQRRVYLLIGSVLGMLVLAGVFGAARLVRPVRVLSAAARRMAHGDLENPIVIREGGEIGDLAGDMEGMRVRLRASLGQIQELNQHLEGRIAERTHQLEQRNRELVSASAIAETVTSSIHLQEVLNSALGSVAEATGEESLAIFLLDAAGQRLALAAGRGLRPPFAISETSVAKGECLCGQVLVTGEPIVVGDILGHSQMTRTACSVCGFRSVASFPLQSRERVEGVLAIFSPLPNTLMGHDFPVVQLIARQIAIAIQNARLYAEVEAQTKLARELLEKVMNAQEEERKRLARELHDETGQALTAIGISLESLRAELPVEWKETRERLVDLQQMTQQTLVELRKMVLDLRPSALDDLGLVPAVRRYALQHLEPLGVKLEIEAGGMEHHLEPPVQTLLFRIAQEAINNVARHSRAKHVEIRFWQDEGNTMVMVEDDGIGFDPTPPAKASTTSTTLGLAGMQERAGLLGGRVTISSIHGQGTRVLVRVPSKAAGAVR